MSRLSPEVARVLHEYMSLRGFSVRRLALAVGVGYGYITKLRSGKAAPSMAVAHKIIQVLSIPPEAAEPMLAESIAGVGYDRPGAMPLPEFRPEPPPLPSLLQLANLNEAVDLARLRHGMSEVAPTYVYLARLNGGIKIGSSNNPARRVREFYGELLAVLDDKPGRLYERELHLRFHPYLIERELFRAEGELAEFVAQVAGRGLS